MIFDNNQLDRILVRLDEKILNAIVTPESDFEYEIITNKINKKAEISKFTYVMAIKEESLLKEAFEL